MSCAVCVEGASGVCNCHVDERTNEERAEDEAYEREQESRRIERDAVEYDRRLRLLLGDDIVDSWVTP